MDKLTLVQQKLVSLLGQNSVLYNEPMRLHTSFRIGGPAGIMVCPKSEKEVADSIRTCVECGVPYRILGAGTNILAPDEGLQCVVILLKGYLDGIQISGENYIRASAGVTMTRAAVFAANAGLGGLEFAHGIPGTVGGGVYMNAGAYGGEIGDICTRIGVLHPDGSYEELPAQQLHFSYRHSALENSGDIVLWAEFSMIPKQESEIRARMRELMEKRSSSQPLDMPSAGSAFKRPQGGFAAALIDQAGLRGYRVGDAAISEKHTGFAVNLGNATAAEVKKLLADVSDLVYERNGIRLEPEIRIW